jgi:hypothetical protein
MDLKGTFIIAAGVLLGLLVGVGTLVVVLRVPRADPAAPAAPEGDPVQYQVVTVREGETVVVVVVAVPAPPPSAGRPDSTEQGPKRKNLIRPGAAPAGGEGAAPRPAPPPRLSPW